MWTLIQTESHGGYNRIGYIDGRNPEYGTVMAMYRINNYGELDFYYQYEMNDDVVASFEYWAKRVIGGVETKKDTVTKCADCGYLGDKYSFPLPNDKTGGIDEYPGFGIFFSKDGKYASWDDLVSITEYNSTFKNIQTVGFRQGQENYVAAIRFEDGNIIEE